MIQITRETCTRELTCKLAINENNHRNDKEIILGVC